MELNLERRELQLEPSLIMQEASHGEQLRFEVLLDGEVEHQVPQLGLHRLLFKVAIATIRTRERAAKIVPKVQTSAGYSGKRVSEVCKKASRCVTGYLRQLNERIQSLV